MELPPSVASAMVPGQAPEETSLRLVRQARAGWEQLRPYTRESEGPREALRVVMLRRIAQRFFAAAGGVPSADGLFDPHTYPDADVARLPADLLRSVLDGLGQLDGGSVDYATLPVEHLGAVFETLLAPDERRRTGSHYTPRALTTSVVRTALQPHVEALGFSPEDPARWLALRVHDPAMGAGAFLLESCRQLATHLAATGAFPLSEARKQVAASCLSGVDQNPLAVELAKLSLELLVGEAIRSEGLQVGDSLLDSPRNSRFDVMVGNPPFLGGKRIRTVLGAAYREQLQACYPGTNGNADLCAFFLRRAFEQLRPGGTLGFVTTNTIAQGDTRAGGLRWICQHGGEIYEATKRIVWPGDAAVIVAVVHVIKGEYAGTKRLDGKPVPRISAFLFHTGSNDDPKLLTPRHERAFIGCFLRGAGFTFVPSGPDDLRICDPHYHDVVKPYLGGEEVLTQPDHAPQRFVIQFGARSEEDVRQRWPTLVSHVEKQVRPGRQRLANGSIDQAHQRAWWRFASDRPSLVRAMEGLDHVLAIPRLSRHLTVVRLRTGAVFSDQLVVVPSADFAALTILQSRVHETWARFFSSTLGDGLRYAPSDCFDTFPFPVNWAAQSDLAVAGRAYATYRATLLRETHVGLTTAYHQMHDPHVQDPVIEELRRRHDALDRAVLDAYGWTDLRPTYTFFPSYGDSGVSAVSGTKGPRKAVRRPARGAWTYRWPDHVHDEVLARLLARNHGDHGRASR